MQELCSVCNALFPLQFAYQMVQHRSPFEATSSRFFCSLDCRKSALGNDGFTVRRARRIAILNQKGGTGKTTTSINLAAGIAEQGHSTLLIDTDAQGNVGTSLGVRGEFSLYDVLVEGKPVSEAAIPVREHLDIITADSTLAVAEIWLARLDHERDRMLSKRLGNIHRQYEYVILDCGPSLSLLNQNALMYADEVLIPVSCDYLALVGVKQVLKNLKEIERLLGHSVHILGVLPTFFDSRVRLAKEAVETLRGHFGDRLFQPIHRSARLAEAPSHKKTIFEYDNSSSAAQNYRNLVEQILDPSLARNVRSPEKTTQSQTVQAV